MSHSFRPTSTSAIRSGAPSSGTSARSLLVRAKAFRHGRTEAGTALTDAAAHAIVLKSIRSKADSGRAGRTG